MYLLYKLCRVLLFCYSTALFSISACIEELPTISNRELSSTNQRQHLPQSSSAHAVTQSRPACLRPLLHLQFLYLFRSATAACRPHCPPITAGGSGCRPVQRTAELSNSPGGGGGWAASIRRRCSSKRLAAHPTADLSPARLPRAGTSARQPGLLLLAAGFSSPLLLNTSRNKLAIMLTLFFLKNYVYLRFF